MPRPSSFLLLCSLGFAATAAAAPDSPLAADPRRDPVSQPAPAWTAAPAATSGQPLESLSGLAPAPELGAHLRSAAAGQATNLIFQQTARWILDKDYARIGLGSMRTNLGSRFVFDENHFVTNQFGHPYQGALYHAAARAQGLGFWQSAPYVFLGSLSWEYLMETERPSINDLITTTVGGLVFGEATFRLAEAVLDDRARGGERFGRELLALLIQPAYGLTRLVDGRAFASGPGALRPPLGLRLHLSSAGGRFSNGLRGTGVRLGLRYDYGSLTSTPRDPAPFDLFSAEASLALAGARDEALRQLDLGLAGLAWGRRFGLGAPCNAIFGVWGRFDYLASSILDLGTSGAGPGLMVEVPLFGPLDLRLELMLMAHFGGMTAEHPEVSLRDYDFGVGPGARLQAQLRLRGWGELFVEADRYGFQVLTGVEGRQFAGFGVAGLRFELPAGLRAGLQFGVVDTHSWYAEYGDIHENFRGTELFVEWQAGQ